MRERERKKERERGRERDDSVSARILQFHHVSVKYTWTLELPPPLHLPPPPTSFPPTDRKMEGVTRLFHLSFQRHEHVFQTLSETGAVRVDTDIH